MMKPYRHQYSRKDNEIHTIYDYENTHRSKRLVMQVEMGGLRELAQGHYRSWTTLSIPGSVTTMLIANPTTEHLLAEDTEMTYRRK